VAIPVEKPVAAEKPPERDLVVRLSAAAIAAKVQEGDWQTCDLLREARDEIIRLREERD